MSTVYAQNPLGANLRDFLQKNQLFKGKNQLFKGKNQLFVGKSKIFPSLKTRSQSGLPDLEKIQNFLIYISLYIACAPAEAGARKPVIIYLLIN